MTDPAALSLPFYPYSRYLRERFSRRVRKLCVDAGFTCPNLDGRKGHLGCTFCNNAAFSAGSRGERLDLRRQFERGRRYLARRYGATDYLVYFQAYSNTDGPVQKLERLYRTFENEPDVVGVAIGTRADCLEPAVVDLLDDLAAETHVTLEIGIQSIHDRTLRKIRRGHSWRDTVTALERCSDRRFDLCLHVILGLPGEGRGEVRETATTLARYPFHGVKLHNLHVVRGTTLAEAHRAGRLHLPDFATYISWAADFLERTPPGVAVQRLVGDAPPALLLSEPWCHDKQRAYRHLTAELQRRGTSQGDRCQSALHPLVAGT
ncbi:MAG: TIGR01212 family radical SAM protein [Nitrospirota bacterium]|jgi:radical SAM protein (TIGR01212 family)